MLDPCSVRRLFPSRREVEDYEWVLLESALAELVASGERAAERWLREERGLTRGEARAAIDMVDDLAQRGTSRSTEAWRARLLAHYEDLRRRAREACDIRTERWALRDLASVSGVLKSPVDDLHRDVLRAVERLDEEDRAIDEPEDNPEEPLNLAAGAG